MGFIQRSVDQIETQELETEKERLKVAQSLFDHGCRIVFATYLRPFDKLPVNPTEWIYERVKEQSQYIPASSYLTADRAFIELHKELTEDPKCKLFFEPLERLKSDSTEVQKAQADAEDWHKKNWEYSLGLMGHTLHFNDYLGFWDKPVIDVIRMISRKRAIHY